MNIDTSVYFFRKPFGIRKLYLKVLLLFVYFIFVIKILNMPRKAEIQSNLRTNLWISTQAAWSDGIHREEQIGCFNLSNMNFSNILLNKVLISEAVVLLLVYWPIASSKYTMRRKGRTFWLFWRGNWSEMGSTMTNRNQCLSRHSIHLEVSKDFQSVRLKKKAKESDRDVHIWETWRWVGSLWSFFWRVSSQRWSILSLSLLCYYYAVIIYLL